MYYQRLQNITDTVGEANIEGCARSMSVYSIPVYTMVGQLRSPNENLLWIWNEPGCREVGLTAEGRAAAQAENERPAKRAATTDDAAMDADGLGGLGEL